MYVHIDCINCGYALLLQFFLPFWNFLKKSQWSQKYSGLYLSGWWIYTLRRSGQLLGVDYIWLMLFAIFYDWNCLLLSDDWNTSDSTTEMWQNIALPGSNNNSSNLIYKAPFMVVTSEYFSQLNYLCQNNCRTTLFMGLSSADCRSKVCSFGQWVAANCAALPTANAGQNATLHC